MVEHGAPRSWLQCQCRKCMSAYNASRMEQTPRKPRKGDAPHGTPRAYQGWHCRCEECTEAYMMYREQVYARRYLARFGLDLDEVLTQSRTSHR